MENRNFFKGVYDDFFGIEKLRSENEKLRQELNITDDFPTIEVNRENVEKQNSADNTKQNKDEKMKELFDKIENLYISEESKTTLKKIIEYLRKYEEQIEKQYIPFNMCIYSDDKETIYKLTDLIDDAVMYFNYIKTGDMVETSLYNLEKVEDLEKIYSAQNGVIVLKDFEGIISQEQIFRDKFWNRIKEKQEEKDKFLSI